MVWATSQARPSGGGRPRGRARGRKRAGASATTASLSRLPPPRTHDDGRSKRSRGCGRLAISVPVWARGPTFHNAPHAAVPNGGGACGSKGVGLGGGAPSGQPMGRSNNKKQKAGGKRRLASERTKARRSKAGLAPSFLFSRRSPTRPTARSLLELLCEVNIEGSIQIDSQSNGAAVRSVVIVVLFLQEKSISRICTLYFHSCVRPPPPKSMAGLASLQFSTIKQVCSL